jgi:hypothetical protein
MQSLDEVNTIILFFEDLDMSESVCIVYKLSKTAVETQSVRNDPTN